MLVFLAQVVAQVLLILLRSLQFEPFRQPRGDKLLFSFLSNLVGSLIGWGAFALLASGEQAAAMRRLLGFRLTWVQALLVVAQPPVLLLSSTVKLMCGSEWEWERAKRRLRQERLERRISRCRAEGMRAAGEAGERRKAELADLTEQSQEASSARPEASGSPVGLRLSVRLKIALLRLASPVYAWAAGLWSALTPSELYVDFLAPLFEEFNYRALTEALLLPEGVRAFRRAATSNAFFGLAHSLTFRDSFRASKTLAGKLRVAILASQTIVVQTLAFGMISSYLLWLTGSVWPCVVLHSLCNIIGPPQMLTARDWALNVAGLCFFVLINVGLYLTYEGRAE